MFKTTLALSMLFAIVATLTVLQTANAVTDPQSTVINYEEKDTDGDGVLDYQDACPSTPMNIVVDAQGCPTPVEVSCEGMINDF